MGTSPGLMIVTMTKDHMARAKNIDVIISQGDMKYCSSKITDS